MIIVDETGGGTYEPEVPEKEYTFLIDEELKEAELSLYEKLKQGLFPKTVLEPEITPVLEPVREGWITPSMSMSDEEIRLYLIEEVWVKHNQKIIPYSEMIWSTNIWNLQAKINFVNDLKKYMKKLARLPDDTTHSAQYDRVRAIAKNIDILQEVYEEAPEFRIERFKDKLEGASLVAKLIFGLSITAVVLFGAFVLYNYLKSYGTELGKVQARD